MSLVKINIEKLMKTQLLRRQIGICFFDLVKRSMTESPQGPADKTGGYIGTLNQAGSAFGRSGTYQENDYFYNKNKEELEKLKKKIKELEKLEPKMKK